MTQKHPLERKDRLTYEALTNPEAYDAWLAELDAQREVASKSRPSLRERIAALTGEAEVGKGEAA